MKVDNIEWIKDSELHSFVPKQGGNIMAHLRRKKGGTIMEHPRRED